MKMFYIHHIVTTVSFLTFRESRANGKWAPNICYDWLLLCVDVITNIFVMKIIPINPPTTPDIANLLYILEWNSFKSVP